MRDILFRGQTRRPGEKVRINGEKVPGNWVYGGVFPGTGDFSIIYGSADKNLTGKNLDKRLVYSDTVGQFTGKCDKTGTKAFEHDCVRELHYGTIGVIQYGEYQSRISDGLFSCHIGFYVDWLSGRNKDVLRKDLRYWLDCGAEIIGNIHDNPELLKGGDTV